LAEAPSAVASPTGDGPILVELTNRSKSLELGLLRQRRLALGGILRTGYQVGLHLIGSHGDGVVVTYASDE
jgi:hypothetical protein